MANFEMNNEVSFKFRAYNVLAALMNHEDIRDVTLIEFHDEFYWYVLETDKTIDDLYSILNLPYSVEQYNILFEHSYSKAEDKLKYIKEHIFAKDANKISYTNGAYNHLIIENEVTVKETYSLNGEYDVIVVNIPELEIGEE